MDCEIETAITCSLRPTATYAHHESPKPILITAIRAAYIKMIQLPFHLFKTTRLYFNLPLVRIRRLPVQHKLPAYGLNELGTELTGDFISGLFRIKNCTILNLHLYEFMH